MTDLARQLTEPGSFGRFCHFLYPPPEGLPSTDLRKKTHVALKPFHYEWADGISLHDEYLILGPRGHLKSTICSQAHSLWRLAKNPDARICLIANDAREAKKDLRYIKNQMTNNAELIALFPHLAPGHTMSSREQRRTGQKWTEEQITVSGRLAAGEVSILAVGIYGGITGQHYEHIIITDIVDFENSRTEYQRKKLEAWLAETVEGTLMAGGTITYIGTRYHWEDMYAHKINAELRHKHIRNSAINYDETGNEVALFPELMDLEELQRRRARMGTMIFNAQYQNNTDAMKGALFKPDWLRYWDEQPPADFPTFAGFDPAIGQKQTNDYTAWAVVAIDSKTREKYLIEAGRERLTFSAQIDKALDIARRHPHLTAFGVEAVSYQQVLVETLQQKLSMITAIQQTRDKVSRAQEMSVEFENGRVLLGPKGMHAATESELLAFPEGEHDDQVDALEMACRLADEHIGTYASAYDSIAVSGRHGPISRDHRGWRPI